MSLLPSLRSTWTMRLSRTIIRCNCRFHDRLHDGARRRTALAKNACLVDGRERLPFGATAKFDNAPGI